MTNVKSNMSLNYNTLTEKDYYHFAHDVVMLFGLTELKAYVTWKENGIEKRCVFSIIVNSVRSKDREGVKQPSFTTTESTEPVSNGEMPSAIKRNLDTERISCSKLILQLYIQLLES
ncbi:hypothetical protein M378DRAFT_469229 [Amanita muscaria Koide BX008]|uniref:Uncharacterized protein n=1 Tax=Amanita muscaria (strain Koide BX008) TaxID=946122 RepID=A0A0C2WIJ6_AMAMK|nr:hypothetical protein M378DRAFT_469229 [Amanita muscaria Koide BX008]